MKDVLVLDKKEQLELIGDPFVHDILDCINYDLVTKEQIINKLNEKTELIEEYLTRLLDNDILTEVVDQETGEKKLRATARSIEGKDIIYDHLNEDELHWLNGYINHLENRIVDLFRYLGRLEDPKETLENLNYDPIPYASINKVYLTKEEAHQLTKMIGDFLKQDKKEMREKSKEDNKYNLYEFYGYLFPELKMLKEKVND